MLLEMQGKLSSIFSKFSQKIISRSDSSLLKFPELRIFFLGYQSWKQLSIFIKSSVLDVLLGSKCPSGMQNRKIIF